MYDNRAVKILAPFISHTSATLIHDQLFVHEKLRHFVTHFLDAIEQKFELIVTKKVIPEHFEIKLSPALSNALLVYVTEGLGGDKEKLEVINIPVDSEKYKQFWKNHSETAYELYSTVLSLPLTWRASKYVVEAVAFNEDTYNYFEAILKNSDLTKQEKQHIVFEKPSLTVSLFSEVYEKLKKAKTYPSYEITQKTSCCIACGSFAHKFGECLDEDEEKEEFFIPELNDAIALLSSEAYEVLKSIKH